MIATSIIVYRNPLEQAFWESDAGAWIALIVLAAIALIAVAAGINWLVNRFRP